MEERILKDERAYESSMPRLAGEEDRFVLLAMHQTLVERAIPSPAGRKRIAQRFIAGVPRRRGTSPARDARAVHIRDDCFRPSRAREVSLAVVPAMNRWAMIGRPWWDVSQAERPAVLVNYRFTGFLDEIYATLAKVGRVAPLPLSFRGPPKRRAEDCRALTHADLASAAGRRQSQRHTLPVSRPARCPTWAKLGSRTSVRAGTSANQSNWRPRTETSQNGRIGSGAFHRQKKAGTPHSAFEEPTDSPNRAIRKSAVAAVESGRGNPVTAAKAWTTAPVRTPTSHAGSRPNRCAAEEARFWGGCPVVADAPRMLHGVRAWTW